MNIIENSIVIHLTGIRKKISHSDRPTEPLPVMTRESEQTKMGVMLLVVSSDDENRETERERDGN